jgi:hypothetical protein
MTSVDKLVEKLWTKSLDRPFGFGYRRARVGSSQLLDFRSAANRYAYWSSYRLTVEILIPQSQHNR